VSSLNQVVRKDKLHETVDGERHHTGLDLVDPIHMLSNVTANSTCANRAGAAGLGSGIGIAGHLAFAMDGWWQGACWDLDREVEDRAKLQNRKECGFISCLLRGQSAKRP
jgi:hypothetical protein